MDAAARRKRILVVGSVNRDLSFLTEALPRPGETIAAKFRSGHGGKGSNQAVASGLLSGAGTTVFVGAVGRDSFGDEAEAFLRSRGVECRVLRTDSSTGLASITVDAKGENIIVLALGANMDLTPEAFSTVSLDDIEPTCVLLQLEIPVDTVSAIIRRYSEYNKGKDHRERAHIILNPAPFNKEMDFRSVGEYVDCFTPNETEFESTVRCVCGETREIDFADGKALHGLCKSTGMRRVVITLGAKGCFYSNTDTGFFAFVEAERREAVDTTGAGDAFNGALAAFIHRELTREGGAGDVGDEGWLAACAFACRAAGVSVTRPGTAVSFATLDELDG